MSINILEELNKLKTVQVLGSRVLVKVHKPESVSSLLELQDNDLEMPSTATVLLVGPGKDEELSVKQKHEVIFTPGAGQKIKIDEAEYTILEEDEIFAILK